MEFLSLEADGERLERALALREICCAYECSEQRLSLPWLGISQAVPWDALKMLSPKEGWHCTSMALQRYGETALGPGKLEMRACGKVSVDKYEANLPKSGNMSER